MSRAPITVGVLPSATFDVREAAAALRDDAVYAFACVGAVQRAIRAERLERTVRYLLAIAARATGKVRDAARTLDVAVNAAVAAQADPAGDRN